MFTILIPTLDNLPYLKVCINSIINSSSQKNEILVHVNEDSEHETRNFLNENNIKFSHTKKNVGLCSSINLIAKQATFSYLIYSHDDMYFCPNWDIIFKNELDKIGSNEKFFFSGTMIQPFKSYINLDCGKDINEFNEAKLLNESPQIKFKDFQGTHWQPSLISLNTWKKVGGFSQEFSPGLGSDPDFNMKLWNIGVRLFKGLGDCRVYHFSSVSLRKKVWNKGAKTFLLKWGISIKFFKKYYLRSDTIFEGPLKEPKKNLKYYIGLLKCKINFFFTSILNK